MYADGSPKHIRFVMLALVSFGDGPRVLRPGLHPDADVLRVAAHQDFSPVAVRTLRDGLRVRVRRVRFYQAQSFHT